MNFRRTVDFTADIKYLSQNDKPQRTINYLEHLHEYFFMSGTFDETEMLECIERISKFQKTLLKSKKVLTKFHTLILEHEARYAKHRAKAKQLARMMDELEKLSFDLYARPPSDTSAAESEDELFDEPKVFDALTYDTNQNLLVMDRVSPYTATKHWISFKIIEADALLEALSHRRRLQKKCESTMQATSEKLSELHKLEQGIKSWHNFWQSKDQL